MEFNYSIMRPCNNFNCEIIDSLHLLVLNEMGNSEYGNNIK